MRKIFCLACLLVLFNTLCAAQTASAPDWSAWKWLMGTWDGSGSGKPGSGAGSFSLLPELDRQILVRKAHSEYPAAEGRPATKHDDLMIVYKDGDKWRAEYWDNEGHVIHYTASVTSDQARFISDPDPHSPTFHLIYNLQTTGEVEIVFEVAPPGSDKFQKYIGGTVHRREEK